MDTIETFNCADCNEDVDIENMATHDDSGEYCFPCQDFSNTYPIAYEYGKRR